jgi:hypothetical protein
MSIHDYEIDDMSPQIAVDELPYFILQLHNNKRPLRLRIRRTTLANLKDEIERRLEEYPEGGDDP